MSLIRTRRRQPVLRTPRFFQRFRRNTEASFCPGNRVELLRDGRDFFEAMQQGLLEATGRVCLEFYIIKNDSTGNAFADTLLALADRGVSVLLLYDYIGCFDTPSTYFRRLMDGGVQCLPFNPLSFKRGIGWFDKRDHRKMAIIDGRTAFVCGINIADEYAGSEAGVERWRDLGVRVDGPVAAQLEELFRESWRHEGGGLLPVKDAAPAEGSGNAGVLVVNGGPHHTRSFIRSAFRMAMAGASETIRIINPYFVPGPRVMRSLLRAAGRGVRVQLILPARCDVPLVRLVSRSYYAPLLKGGVEIYEHEETILHAKVMLIDDCWAVVGSANLDLRSFHRNFELNVIVDSQDFGSQVAAMFLDDLSRSRRIELAEHERRGWMVRILERTFAPINWFL